MHGRRFTMINGFATRPLLAVGVALALSGVPSAWAQVPSAGQVMRDIENGCLMLSQGPVVNELTG